MQATAPTHVTSINLTIRATPLNLNPTQSLAVAAHWADQTAGNPTYFNGSAFLFDELTIDAAAQTLAAEGAPTDFATFLYWRRHRDALPFSHAFPVGAIVTTDKKLVIGHMSAHTANPGKFYPPAGSFDANDLTPGPDGTGTLDPVANIRREIAEEIGLDIAKLTPTPDWLVLPSTPRAYAIVKILHAAEGADELAPRLRRHIAEDPHQELADLLFVEFGTRFADGTASPYVNDLLAYLEATG